MAEKAAETKEAGAEVTAETVAEEMAENVTGGVAETEIFTVKMAETELFGIFCSSFIIIKNLYKIRILGFFHLKTLCASSSPH